MKTFEQNWEIYLVKAAAQAISNAEEIYILGYSLPDADAMVNFVLAEIQKDTKIYIINPSNPMDIANRFIMRYGLDKNKIIYEQCSLEEWIQNDFQYIKYEKEQEEIRDISKGYNLKN